jgi:hypothetical protein
METFKFEDLVSRKKLNSCSSCDSYSYTLPLPITREIDSYLICFGALKYPLDKIQIIKLDNDHFRIESRVGSTEMKVKFKTDPAQRALFEIQLAAYISSLQSISVTTGG